MSLALWIRGPRTYLGVSLSEARSSLGRDPKATICLPDPSVGRLHVTLERRGPNYLISCQGHANGTQFWSARGREPVWLSPLSPRILRSGDRFRLGRVEACVQSKPPSEDAELVDPEHLPLALVRQGLEAHGRATDPSDLQLALDELLHAEDELLPDAPRSQGETSTASSVQGSGETDPENADRMWLAIIAAVLLAGLCALFWIVERA